MWSKSAVPCNSDDAVWRAGDDRMPAELVTTATGAMASIASAERNDSALGGSAATSCWEVRRRQAAGGRPGQHCRRHRKRPLFGGLRHDNFGAGNDRLNGGEGRDLLNGGNGNDVFLGVRGGPEHLETTSRFPAARSRSPMPQARQSSSGACQAARRRRSAARTACRRRRTIDDQQARPARVRRRAGSRLDAVDEGGTADRERRWSSVPARSSRRRSGTCRRCRRRGWSAIRRPR